MEMLTLTHVSKSFGDHTVLEDLSFSVPEHSIFGFIGSNGAGKTTTMKMILGLLKADSGQILVDQRPVTYGQNITNRLIGYLPDVPEFYGFLTPAEYLTLAGRIAKMPEHTIAHRSRELLDLVGLGDVKKRIHGFSRGMKQRLGIAQALLGKPRLLICDEPTSALDPLGRKEILDILSAVKNETTVLFSTHILSDVERICDEIALLHQGKIAWSGTLAHLHQHQDAGFQMEFLRPDDLSRFAAGCPGGKVIGKTELLYEHKNEKDMLYAIQILAENSIPVRKIEMCEFTLEHLFMKMTGNETA
ncbi:ABC transporter ATP-binding protein [Roseburia hominis]